MAESQDQGISRRDLLKRGAALGGAVVWATPVVQTLGMGRAYAQPTSPVGRDISYIGINVVCGEDEFFVKWEDGGWEDSPGAAPVCAPEAELNGVASGGEGFAVSPDSNDSCRTLNIPVGYLECEITVWVKAGQICRIYNYPGDLIIGDNLVCSEIVS